MKVSEPLAIRFRMVEPKRFQTFAARLLPEEPFNERRQWGGS
jgi:hypothetical protein